MTRARASSAWRDATAMRFARHASRLSLVAILATLAACAGTPPRTMPEPITLPVNAEPAFQLARYADLPPGSHMLVRWDTAGLVGQLMQHLPALLSNRASLTLEREQLILSAGTPFRRSSLSFVDTATHSAHGPCRQAIHVWFAASGEIAGIHVEPQVCPGQACHEPAARQTAGRHLHLRHVARHRTTSILRGHASRPARTDTP